MATTVDNSFDLVRDSKGNLVGWQRGPGDVVPLHTMAKPGCVQTLKIFGAAGQTAAAAFTFATAWMVEGKYNAVRFLYGNYGTGTYPISAAKTAPAPDIANVGTGLTWANITFDKSASAKASDTWDGLSGSTTTYTMPARVSGSGANVVPSLVWSDWVPQTSIPCTDAGSTDLCVIHQRVYTSSTSYTVCNGGTSATNYGNYNAFSRRKVYGGFTGGDQVSTITSMTPTIGHQWMMCLGVQALLTKPVYNHAFFGDSITKGQGSFDNSNGAWGFAQRSVQYLTDAGLGTHSVVNYAAAGQSRAATFATFLAVISQGGIDTATMFPWSPNDGITAGATPWALNDYVYQVHAFIGACRAAGVIPVVCTQPPSVTITDIAGDLIRQAINADLLALRGSGVVVVDMNTEVTNAALPARYATGLSGDNQHPTSSGYELMSVAWQKEVRDAILV